MSPKLSRRSLLNGAVAASFAFPSKVRAWRKGNSGTTGITINEVPSAGFVFNRSQGSTSGRPFITGTYTDGGPNPEFQIELKAFPFTVIAPWAAAVNLIQSGGQYSGYGPSVPQSIGMIYICRVRCSANHAITAVQTNSWDIGVNALFTGQSNMNTLCASGDGSVVPAAGTYHITRDASNPNIFTASFVSNAVVNWGNGGTTILNAIAAAQSPPCSVCGLNMSANATNIDFDYGALFDGVIPDGNTVQAVKLWFGGDYEIQLFNGGEAQYQYSPQTLTHATYLGWMQTGQTKGKSLTGRSVMPVYFTSIGQNTSFPDPAGSAPGKTNWPYQQRSYIDGPNIYANIYYAGDNMDDTTVDGLHQDIASCTRHGQRFAQSILFNQGWSATKLSPWFVTAGSITSATVTRVTLVHSAGTDFTPTSSISGFEVSENGSTWISATGARVDATHIDLTHSSLSTALRFVRHQWDTQPPLAGMVHDNSTIQSPLNFTPVPLRCTNSTVPAAVVQPESNQVLTNFGGSATLVSTEQLISAQIGDFLVLNLSMGGGSQPPDTITILPSGGSSIPLTKVVGTASNGGSIWKSAALTAAIDFTQRCTVTCTWASTGVFTVCGFMAYVMSGFSSTAQTGSAVATPAISPSAPSLTLNVAAGGCVIANCTSQNPPGLPSRSDVVQITGANGFTNDSPWSGTIVSPIFGFGSSANCAANASTLVSLSFNGTSGTAYLVAAAWGP